MVAVFFCLFNFYAVKLQSKTMFYYKVHCRQGWLNYLQNSLIGATVENYLFLNISADTFIHQKRLLFLGTASFGCCCCLINLQIVSCAAPFAHRQSGVQSTFLWASLAAKPIVPFPYFPPYALNPGLHSTVGWCKALSLCLQCVIIGLHFILITY